MEMETFVTRDYFDYEFDSTESGAYVGLIRQQGSRRIDGFYS